MYDIDMTFTQIMNHYTLYFHTNIAYYCINIQHQPCIPSSSFLFIAMYYRGAAAAIVVYDITRAQSFKTLKNWVEELKSKGPKDIVIAIAGNKADLEVQRVRRDVETIIVDVG